MQRRPWEGDAAAVDVGARRHELAHAAAVATRTCEVQRREPRLVKGVAVAARREQRAQACLVGGGGGAVRGQHATGTAHKELGRRRREQRSHAVGALQRCAVQRRQRRASLWVDAWVGASLWVRG